MLELAWSSNTPTVCSAKTFVLSIRLLHSLHVFISYSFVCVHRFHACSEHWEHWPTGSLQMQRRMRKALQRTPGLERPRSQRPPRKASERGLRQLHLRARQWSSCRAASYASCARAGATCTQRSLRTCSPENSCRSGSSSCPRPTRPPCRTPLARPVAQSFRSPSAPKRMVCA